jgi:hypothetical protein
VALVGETMRCCHTCRSPLQELDGMVFAGPAVSDSSMPDRGPLLAEGADERGRETPAAKGQGNFEKVQADHVSKSPA